MGFNPLNAKLNPICHLPALLGAHHILHVSRIRVNSAFKWLNWMFVQWEQNLSDRVEFKRRWKGSSQNAFGECHGRSHVMKRELAKCVWRVPWQVTCNENQNASWCGHWSKQWVIWQCDGQTFVLWQRRQSVQSYRIKSRNCFVHCSKPTRLFHNVNRPSSSPTIPVYRLTL